MFQLYKKRNFNALINDTFIFFRAMGKNFFGNYLKITGGFLVILLLLTYLIGKVFFENIFLSTNSVEQQNMLSKYFDDNLVYFITIGSICALLMMLITAITYAFPVVYFNIIKDNKNITPTTKELVKGLKGSVWKIIKFIFWSLIIFTPIIAILGSICVLLMMILVGIPLAVIVFAFISCWASLAFYDYLSNDVSFFKALANGWKLVFVNFWPNVGTTVIFWVMVYIVHSIVSIIFYIISGLFTLMDIDPTNHADTMSSFGILILIVFIISTALSYLLSNIIVVNQGIIYYSSKEEIENNSLRSDIDLIGENIE
ncbi:MAG: hypothetical protein BM557_08790 [Flavobacterium sp. MedPE-SWcel]|uniref:hypothetical protein n=1 Tax=uncultured Flavobacterium sp. TaxID=165435 RepID=UPI00091A4D79|nr:hypothetical protein [uncultured Flavobacterium sp.]OIQ17297.1 MAG: hypothetical protein BM557_08790 [Flavobacterium sp. MedPE-SWcel]